MRTVVVVIVAGYLALTTVSVACGVLLSAVVDNSSGGWDVDVVDEVFVKHRTPWWNDVSGVASTLGNTGTIVGIGAIIVVVYALRRLWGPALLITIALVVEVSVFLTTTALVDRERPPLARLDEAPPTSSFPSGHTAAACVLYIGLALILNERVRHRAARVTLWVVAVTLVVSVALARLYRAMHHPTDVAAGALIGAASLTIAVLAVTTASASRADTGGLP